MGKSEDVSFVIFPAQTCNLGVIILLSLVITCWTGVLFFESTRPAAKFMGLIPQLDKVAHFGAFGILGLLVCFLSLALWPTASTIPLFSMPLLVVTLCGLTEEGIQMFVAGRMASIPDLLADMGGGVVAIQLTNLMRRYGKARAGSMRGNL